MDKRELSYAVGWGVVVMLATCIPHLIMWWYLPLDGVYPWVLQNSDDHGVYYAWLKQGRDGAVFFRNMFTTEPQSGAYFHFYYLVLGWVSRLTGLDVPTTNQLGRLVFGVVTLVLSYRLAALFTADQFTRRCCFWTVALSSGVGWVVWTNHPRQWEPVDVWQPEAITFSSLYSNGLFAVSLSLMLGVILFLLLAERRGWPWAIGAGLCGLVLGNIHSYDVIHLTLAWGLYLLARWRSTGQVPTRELGHALLAAAVASPSVAHMAWLYKTEPVFRQRADAATWSRGLWLYLFGFGLVVPLAAWGFRRYWQGSGAGERARGLLLPAWIFGALIAAYLPLAFQRKMIMGIHVPLAILAGFAVAELARRAAARLGGGGGERRQGVLAGVAAAGIIAVLSPSSVLYPVRDVQVALQEQVTSTGIHPVYWQDSFVRSLEWIGENTPRTAGVLTAPFYGVFAPTWSGRAVFAGHWAETPRFGPKLDPAFEFYWGTAGSEQREQFLRENRITHVVESRYEREFAEALAEKQRPLSPQRPLASEPFLAEVYRTGTGAAEAVVYEVR